MRAAADNSAARDGAWHASALDSGCPDDQVTTPARIDPYWAGLWSGGSSASWVSADLARRQVAAGLSRLPARLGIGEDEAWEFLTDGNLRAQRLSWLATIDQWRTVTCEQAAAISGYHYILDGQSTAAAAAFTTGIIDIGRYQNQLLPGKMANRGTLYRPSRTEVFTERLTPTLTYPEWVAVTGGHPWASGGQYDRHNILSTELGLRLAEYADIGTVIGEKLSTIELLAGSGIGRQLHHPDRRSADLTVVRADGLRIAVELTASIGAQFKDKVHRWAQLLSSTPLSTSGLMVLFVVADPWENRAAQGPAVRSTATRRVVEAVRRYPGVAGDRVAARMAVACWRDWFPGHHLISPEFLAMSCQRPTGPPRRWWEPAELLGDNAIDFAPRNPDWAGAILTNAHSLAGVPYWLRDPDTQDPQWLTLLANNQMVSFPIPGPVRPNRIKGRPFGAGVGAAGATQPPERLLGPQGAAFEPDTDASPIDHSGVGCDRSTAATLGKSP